MRFTEEKPAQRDAVRRLASTQIETHAAGIGESHSVRDDNHRMVAVSALARRPGTA